MGIIKQGAFNCITNYATAKVTPSPTGLEPVTVGLTDHIKIAVCAFKVFIVKDRLAAPVGFAPTRSGLEPDVLLLYYRAISTDNHIKLF